MTYQQLFKSAMKCKTKAEAEKWMLAEVERFYTLPDFKGGEQEARKIILNNLGYMAGYYDSATAKKVNKLFGAVHPVFGTDTYFEDVTPEQAFEAGKKLGTELTEDYWGHGKK
jgi:hypothetical protein